MTLACSSANASIAAFQSTKSSSVFNEFTFLETIRRMFGDVSWDMISPQWLLSVNGLMVVCMVVGTGGGVALGLVLLEVCWASWSHPCNWALLW